MKQVYPEYEVWPKNTPFDHDQAVMKKDPSIRMIQVDGSVYRTNGNPSGWAYQDFLDKAMPEEIKQQQKESLVNKLVANLIDDPEFEKYLKVCKDETISMDDA